MAFARLDRDPGGRALLFYALRRLGSMLPGCAAGERAAHLAGQSAEVEGARVRAVQT